MSRVSTKLIFVSDQPTHLEVYNHIIGFEVAVHHVEMAQIREPEHELRSEELSRSRVEFVVVEIVQFLHRAWRKVEDKVDVAVFSVHVRGQMSDTTTVPLFIRCIVISQHTTEVSYTRKTTQPSRVKRAKSSAGQNGLTPYLACSLRSER